MTSSRSDGWKGLWKVERYDALEHLLLRAGFAVVVWYHVLRVRTYSEQPVPNGIAHYVDLSFMGDDSVVFWLRFALVAALAAYVWGRWSLASLGYICAYLVALGTLKNSQGAIGHSGQLICVVAIAQWLAHVAHPVLSHFGMTDRTGVMDLSVDFAKQLLAATYMTAACTKLIVSKGRWIADSVNLAVSISKANQQDFYNFGATETLAKNEAITEWLLTHPTLTTLMFGGAFFLEMGCFLALWGRKMAFLVGVSLIAMHEGIHYMMSLHFYFNIHVILVYYVQLPCILVWLGRKYVAPRLPPAVIDRLQRLLPRSSA